MAPEIDLPLSNSPAEQETARSESVYYSESIFSIVLSLIFVGILFFAALVNNIQVLAGISGGTLLVILGARGWSRISPLKLSYTVRLDKNRLFPGENAVLKLALENRKLLPVHTGIQSRFVSAGETDIGPYEQAERTWVLTAVQRGVYPLDDFKLTLGDPFGLFHKNKPLPTQGEILVFPRIQKSSFFSDASFQEFFGIHPAKGLVEDPAWYAGTRDYTGNRPARHIHWKASARFRSLQEKIFEPTSHARVLIVFKTIGFNRFPKKVPIEGGTEERTTLFLSHSAPLNEPFETMLEVIAYMGNLLADAGATFAFLTDAGIRGRGTPFLSMGQGYAHFGQLLEKLARAELPPGLEGELPPKTQGIPPLFQQARQIGKSGTGYVYCCSDPSEEGESYYFVPHARRNRLCILTPQRLR
ncbi:MAG TPA: DUF58 domain-containing protein [Spirochaetales bacterium]|nr:DUF58 domain-containing protein [Spirochaetales bacterium]